MNARDLLADRLARPVTEALNQYTAVLAEGVVEHWTDINELLATYSQGWSVERMPSVDRAILRLGAFEVLYGEGVPVGVAIAEAVELAKTLSTDESPKFVNGLLARLAEVKPTLAWTLRANGPPTGSGPFGVPAAFTDTAFRSTPTRRRQRTRPVSPGEAVRRAAGERLECCPLDIL